MGALVIMRLRSRRSLSISASKPRTFTHAGKASTLLGGATLALFAGLPSPVHAVPFNLSPDRANAQRPVPRPAPIVHRPALARTATTAFAKGNPIGKPDASVS